MSRLRIDEMKRVILLVIVISIICFGCATVWDEPLPPPSQRTKSEVLKIWGTPDRIYTEFTKLKYGADEVWIYKIRDDPSLIEERLYFKDGILIKREGITLDSF